MILDAHQEFSTAQAITVTAVSDNIIDLGPLNTGIAQAIAAGVGVNEVRDIGAGEDQYLQLQVDAAFTAAGAATLTVTWETDDNSAFTSATVLFTSTTFALADLAINAQPLRIKLPRAAYERFNRLRYTVATGPMTAGSVTSFVNLGVQDSRTYAKGFKIS
jgi:hypothetical protein